MVTYLFLCCVLYSICQDVTGSELEVWDEIMRDELIDVKPLTTGFRYGRSTGFLRFSSADLANRAVEFQKEKHHIQKIKFTDTKKSKKKISKSKKTKTRRDIKKETRHRNKKRKERRN